jgi:hypothetical protein
MTMAGAGAQRTARARRVTQHASGPSYFQTIDPAILTGLEAEAQRLRQKGAKGPPQALIEDVTSGILVEPGEELITVTLIPQFHKRPYNEASSTGGSSNCSRRQLPNGSRLRSNPAEGDFAREWRHRCTSWRRG